MGPPSQKTLRATPYKDLGQCIETWRRHRYRSALALFKEQKSKFSFSYYRYVDFEKGTDLPTIDEFLELVKFFNQNPKPAALLWAQVQMPTQELKKIFSERAKHSVKEQGRLSSSPPSQPRSAVAPSLENTWVLNEKDRIHLTKAPWLWEFLLRLALTYPESVSRQQLGFKTPEAFKTFIKQNLKPWIEAGFVIQDTQGLKLRHRHLHLPKGDEWHELRFGNLKRALETLTQEISPQQIHKKEAYRGLLNRPLTDAQMKKWIEKLEALEKDFLAEPYEGEAPANATSTPQISSLLLVLGKRSLT